MLVTEPGDALWVTSWPFAEYVHHAWPGAWTCSAFRNEARERYLSSDLIREAVGVTRWAFGEPPDLPWPFITFVDATKTRRKRDPGRCFLRAGWQHIGYTGKGLIALGLAASEIGEPIEPVGAQMALLG